MSSDNSVQSEPEEVKTVLPEVVTVDEFAKWMKISKTQAYILTRRMPDSMKYRVGDSIRIMSGPLNEWLKAGGTRGEGQ
jgi:hypothetical protein